MTNETEINRLLDLHKETKDIKYFEQAVSLMDKEDIMSDIAKEIRGELNEK